MDDLKFSDSAAEENDIEPPNSSLKNKMNLFSSTQAMLVDADLDNSLASMSASAPPITRKRKSGSMSGVIKARIPLRKHKHPRLYHNHATHWEDGDVYVRAGTTRFKLHKSRLARLSTWFREIFEQNTVEDAQEVMEVVLDKMDVCAEDFTALLDALDDSIKYTYTKPTFYEVASILRASTALSFESFKPWAHQYLEAMWPSALNSMSTARTPLATETIILARLCSVSSVLKRALYELVRMEGFGQVYEIQDDGEDAKSVGILSAADHILLTKAREKLGSRWIKIALSFPKDLDSAPSSSANIGMEREVKLELPQDDIQAMIAKPGAVCINIECTLTSLDNANRAHRKLVHDSEIFETYIWDPICGIQALIDAPWAEEGFCTECVEKMKDKWRRQKEETWSDLDVWFGL